MSTPMISGRPTAAAADISPLRLYFWAVRRELWENRSVYLAPLAVAALIVAGSLISTLNLPGRMSALDPAAQHAAIEEPYIFAAMLLMFTTLVVAVVYCLETFQGERRDRSILFWKSLPVSDATTVLAKASIPLVVLPLVTFVVTVLTQAIMLLSASVRLAGSGLSVWSHLSLMQMWLMLLYHLIAGHSLWYAPYYGWLLMVSAWARRAPLLWATLPLLALGLVEKISFNTTHFGSLLATRFLGGPPGHRPQPHGMSMASLDIATPMQYLTSAGFWCGLALTAAFLFTAVRLRRTRGPV